MAKMKGKISASGQEIAVVSCGDGNDFISLTDIAKYKNPEFPGFVIQNWMRNRAVVEFIGLWERINNQNFNYLEFEVIEKESGKNSFVLTPKRWIEKTGAVGFTSKQGRYAATFAHKDIAIEFASWISAEFKLYIIKDYQRLKADEHGRISLAWNVNREISKINYRIHTDAIKRNLIPLDVTTAQQGIVYAEEADVLNVAMFGNTAKEWRRQNPKSEGNLRDAATIEQLIILSNLESMNAELIKHGLPQNERLNRLNKMAVEQMCSLVGNIGVKKLKECATDGDNKE